MEKKSSYLIFAVCAAGLTLRAPLSSVAAMAGTLIEHFNLSATSAGVLTTLPMLAFALLSSLIPPIAKKIGVGRLLLLGLALMTAGILLRPFTGRIGFFIITFLIGGGIAVGNVLSPAVIKRSFPHRLAAMNGFYTTSVMLSVAFATAFTVPLAKTFLGWQGTLCLWAVFPLAAIFIWLPLKGLGVSQARETKAEGYAPAKEAQAGDAAPAEVGRGGLLRSRVAWYVTMYFGLQSMLFYGIVAWIFTILTAKGFSENVAGIFCTISFCSGIPLSVLYTRLFTRRADHRILALASVLGYLICVLLLALAPWKGAIIAGCIGVGFVSGGLFNSSTFFFTARARDSVQAAKLSGMAQTIGYIFTASISIIMGLLFDMTGNWTAPLLLLALLSVAAAVFGWLAGVNRYVN